MGIKYGQINESEELGLSLELPVEAAAVGQTHVHEFLGSTRFAGQIPHNHRFAGVSSQVIPIPGGGHRHALLVSTDFAIGHLHELGAETGPEIELENGKHIHLVEAETTLNLGHFHEVVFATLIENPTE